jgi:F-type H+-transporting ATPase subunit gamma
MANAGEVKSHMGSVRSTMKITNAMYMISSTKLKKAKAELMKTRPFFELQEHEIRRLFQTRSDIDSPFFYPETGRRPAETYSYLVITADKGLAGGYNMNVLRRMEQERERHKKTRIYMVGEYGRRYCTRRNIPMEQSFLYTAQNPTLQRARVICSAMLGEYLAGRTDEIRIIYSDMKNEVSTEVKVMHLLPFERKTFYTPEERQSHKDREFRFTPSVEEVIARVMPSYITGSIYGALVDSFSAEQNARMTAMRSASKNAEELLNNLKLRYDRLRQAAITQEITEVAAGARAQRKKKMREKE